MEAGDGKPGRPGEDRVVQGIVLEDVFAEEQGRAGGDAAEPLDVGEASVAVTADLLHQFIHAFDRIEGTVSRLQDEPDRDRVDEHTDHLLHPGQLARAPGDVDPDDHVRPAAVCAQDQCPCGLQQRVDSHAVISCESDDLLGVGLTEMNDTLVDLVYRP